MRGETTGFVEVFTAGFTEGGFCTSCKLTGAFGAVVACVNSFTTLINSSSDCFIKSFNVKMFGLGSSSKPFLNESVQKPYRSTVSIRHGG